MKRNRIKRLIKESYRLNEDKAKIGYNIVFLIKKKTDINDITYKNIEDDIRIILKKIE